MASGKSTLGAALAKKRRRKFIDTDKEVEKRCGMTVSDIFSRQGEEEFRRREAEVLHDIALTPGDFIVATGGGTALNPVNMKLMKDTGTVVLITVGAEKTVQRIRMQRGTRPIFAGKEDKEILEMVKKMMTEREPYYQQAHMSIGGEALDTPHGILLTVEQLVNQLKAYKRQRK